MEVDGEEEEEDVVVIGVGVGGEEVLVAEGEVEGGEDAVVGCSITVPAAHSVCTSMGQGLFPTSLPPPAAAAAAPEGGFGTVNLSAHKSQ